jgi:elongation factor P
MKISANSIKSGSILDHDGSLWMVLKNPEHTKPGKGPAYIQVEMKNLKTGNKLNHRFGSTDMVEKAFLETISMQFLYREDDGFIFMDPESFEQVILDKEMLSNEQIAFLTDGMTIEVDYYQEKPLSVKLPSTVILEVVETEPVIKGATVTSSYKPAILTNGLRVMVPPYLVTGEKIVVRTEDVTFVERSK